ncbi:transposase, partial [Bradyrhizobium sp. WSM1253]|uniref:transposase n=1 Tax=Bradyrhizobium sp. WSM1253 TaxID=319003 RepID=UPI0035285999
CAGEYGSLRAIAPRAQKVEMRFAHMKRILRLDRLRLRGLNGVRDEVLLTATAQNLRRLAKLICRLPPQLAVPC